MEGVVLDSYQTVKMLIDRTTTTTGLKVFNGSPSGSIVEKVYHIGQKAATKIIADNTQETRIRFNHQVPKLSYEISPKRHFI